MRRHVASVALPLRLRGAGSPTALIAAIVASGAVAGCSPASAPLPGPCGTYAETPGTALVTSVQPPPAGEYSCPNDPVKVTFDFVPDDPSLSGKAVAGWAVTIHAGMNPPAAAVAACGLGVGSVHSAVRKDEQGGACTPLVVLLTDLGAAGCQAALATCF